MLRVGHVEVEMAPDEAASVWLVQRALWADIRPAIKQASKQATPNTKGASDTL